MSIFKEDELIAHIKTNEVIWDRWRSRCRKLIEKHKLKSEKDNKVAAKKTKLLLVELAADLKDKFSCTIKSLPEFPEAALKNFFTELLLQSTEEINWDKVAQEVWESIVHKKFKFIIEGEFAHDKFDQAIYGDPDDFKARLQEELSKIFKNFELKIEVETAVQR